MNYMLSLILVFVGRSPPDRQRDHLALVDLAVLAKGGGTAELI